MFFNFSEYYENYFLVFLFLNFINNPPIVNKLVASKIIQIILSFGSWLAGKWGGLITCWSSRFFEICFNSLNYCFTYCLDQHTQMVRGLCLPHWYKLVDFCCCCFYGNSDCICNNQFPGNKSGDSQSCKEFENGMRQLGKV